MGQLTNPSKLLLRNEHCLEADSILIINFSQDGFLQQLDTLNIHQNITAFTNNFATKSSEEKISKGDIILDVELPKHDKEHKPFDLIVYYYPKAKAEALMMLDNIRAISSQTTRLLIVGENKGGVKSSEKQLKSLCKTSNKIDSARHCLLYQFNGLEVKSGFEIEHYLKTFELDIKGSKVKVVSLPGVFNHGELDLGTKLLLETMTVPRSGHILDFGCGAGIISAYLGIQNPKLNFTCLDVSSLATKATQLTLAANNVSGKCVLSDGLSKINTLFDHIVSNPPFHTGLATDYDISEQFIIKSKQHISAKGSLTIVANSFLKYQPFLEQSYQEYITVSKTNKFTVYQCIKK
ncbi:methyltransferase [Pseudoalteromonas denitrificans]|uniref:Ribosomal RNA small subunit methyltransferase C n=1 Tax=Pseudoalteromonas denitrificans DSM 6059 TaxID=1123010 RepID=A0A1I1PNH5_9GAMM|nr:methyltransferase [Pseudoalteromonas denitrificans]SFD11326.1 16S rRNA m(2)G 1207 methyltransferase [Pseudoalteromonas denitrificans DSM 6059]